MIKQMVQWKGPDQQTRTKTFYFDLTEFEVAGEMQLEVLYDRFQKFQNEVQNSTPDGESRSLTPPEIREMLDMVKVIIKHAYGEFVEGPDGWEMRKEQEYPGIWPRFVSTGGFNAIIWYLFKDGNEARATAFMENIWPDSYKEARAASLKAVPDQPAQEAVKNVTDDIPSLDNDVAVLDVSEFDVDEKQDPDWNYINFTRDQLLAMNDEDWVKVQKASAQGRNVPLPVIQIDGIRHDRKRAEDGSDH